MDYYPVFLDLRGRPCLVIGGGEVAERKAGALLEAHAQVTVISPECTEELRALAGAGKVRWLERRYRAGDLAGVFLAVAATDDTRVNQAVAGEAQAQGTLLNVVDVPRLCTFIAPSLIRRGPVVLAISTGGLSPALAKKIRIELEASQALRYADMVDLVAEARAELRRKGIAVDPEGWQASLNDEVLELYEAGRREEARTRLLGLLKGWAPRAGAKTP
jgi:precorrin-2 dehydrogenase/sirohydrochlorin ferrochelatase